MNSISRSICRFRALLLGGILLVLTTHGLLAQENRNLFNDSWRAGMRAINSQFKDSFEINEDAVKAAGIQRLSGTHIVLYTDVREPEKMDELVRLFDKSVAQWCQIFKIEPQRFKNWKMRIFLIADPNDTDRFKKAGLIPDELPEFLAGYQFGPNIWLFLQPEQYYMRHLLLHEGTHAVMQWFLNGYGAAWYSEGMAELIGLHRWKDDSIQLNYRLKNRDEAPFWGRVKKIKEDVKNGQAMTLAEVMTIDPEAFLKVRAYAWSWAACDFFSNHSKSKAIFEKIQSQVSREPKSFNRRFLSRLRPHWEELERDWALFINEMEYGYAVERGQLSLATGKSDNNVKNEISNFSIQSDRGWQLTTIKLKKGDRISISGSGEFKVGQTDDDTNQRLDWPCQSNGITINYYRGQPLGMLQAGLLSSAGTTAKAQIAGLLNPVPIGISSEFTASSSGLLCLRINESPASLDDNQGALEVRVEKLE